MVSLESLTRKIGKWKCDSGKFLNNMAFYTPVYLYFISRRSSTNSTPEVAAAGSKWISCWCLFLNLQIGFPLPLLYASWFSCYILLFDLTQLDFNSHSRQLFLPHSIFCFHLTDNAQSANYTSLRNDSFTYVYKHNILLEWVVRNFTTRRLTSHSCWWFG